MTKKTRILILSSSYLPLIGGSELAIKNITDRLPDFEFDLITGRLNKNTPKYEKVGNVTVFRVGGTLGGAKFLLPKVFLPLAIFLKARKLTKTNQYIAIHAFQASSAAGGAWLLKYFYPHTRTSESEVPKGNRSFGVGVYPKLPFIITLQEGKNLEQQGFLINFFRGLILKKADRATAISRYLKNYIFQIAPNLKTEVIPNGVDIEHFSKEFSYGEMTALENKLGVMPDDKVIISVSRLVPKNGVDLLIRATAVLKQRSSDSYRLLLVGDGEQREELKRLVVELGVDDRIIFAGSVNNEDLPLYLKISDVFVRPSRSEGLGSAFLEAMVAGVPIIGTKVGGIPDFLEDRKTGLFCALEPADIAFKISLILENAKLKDEIVKNARELVIERYDWDNIADKFRKIYQNF